MEITNMAKAILTSDVRICSSGLHLVQARGCNQMLG